MRLPFGSLLLAFRSLIPLPRYSSPFFFLFRAYTGTTNLFFFPIRPLFSTPYFAHIFYSWLSCQIYIQVTRSAEVGTDGLRATVQALTIVRAKCAGAIHLTVRRVPGRAWAQLLLEEESCEASLANPIDL